MTEEIISIIRLDESVRHIEEDVKEIKGDMKEIKTLATQVAVTKSSLGRAWWFIGVITVVIFTTAGFAIRSIL